MAGNKNHQDWRA